jgi:ribonucleoside-diphosphate reductase alpha chain
MPRESTVEDIVSTYLDGWRLGLKAVAIYRDGSKESQPLNTESETAKQEKKQQESTEAPGAQPTGLLDAQSKLVQPELIPMGPRRERLPETRRSLTHKFSIGGHEGYIIVGFYEDNRPGELFINMAKEGSTIGGLMDTIGVLTSLALQYGVPLDALVRKFEHSRFEPNGFTRNADIPMAKSVVDYVFRWLGMNYVPGYREANAPNRGETSQAARLVESQGGTGTPAPSATEVDARAETDATSAHKWLALLQADAPPCDECGAITVRNGTCFKCLNCGNSMGCS